MQGDLHCSEGIVVDAAVRRRIVPMLPEHMAAVHRASQQEGRRLEAKASAKRERANRAKAAKLREKKKGARPRPSWMLRSGVDGEYRGGIFYLHSHNTGTPLISFKWFI